MTNIQKKSLNHVLEILKSFETYPVYKAVSDETTVLGIERNIALKISDKCQEAMTIQNKKITSATGWIETLLSDEIKNS